MLFLALAWNNVHVPFLVYEAFFWTGVLVLIDIDGKMDILGVLMNVW